MQVDMIVSTCLMWLVIVMTLSKTLVFEAHLFESIHPPCSFLCTISKSITILATMMNRSLLRTSRLLSNATKYAQATSTYRPFPISSRLPAPARAHISARWYSEAKGETEAKDDAQESVKEEEDPVKKELEAKKKEVVTLKVRRPQLAFVGVSRISSGLWHLQRICHG